MRQKLDDAAGLDLRAHGLWRRRLRGDYRDEINVKVKVARLLSLHLQRQTRR